MEIHVPEVWNELFHGWFDTPVSDVAPRSDSNEAAVIKNSDVLSSRLVVFGGNRVGKSTYNRWLINKLLDKIKCGMAAENGNLDCAEDDPSLSSHKPFVVYIDLDPAQAEFTPPGVISVLKIEDSVHGANHTHLRKPLFSKFLGTLNVSDISSLYMKCAKELIDYVNDNEDLKNAPVVINTMGFCRGIGLKIACSLLCLLKPSIVLQILWEGQRTDDKRSFPWLLKPKAVQNYLQQEGFWWKDVLGNYIVSTTYQYFSFDSVFMMDVLISERFRLWTMNAKELRDAVIVSYFQQMSHTSQPLNIRVVSPTIALLSSVVIATMDSCLTYDGILRAMNGNLVALCSIEIPAEACTDHSTGEVNRNVPKMLTNASRYPNIFHGYGIVRSIDIKNGLMYIITPLDQQELLSSVNCIIAAGKIGLPTQFYFGSALEARNSEERNFFPFLLPKDVSVTRLNEAASRRKVAKRVIPRVLQQSLQ